MNKNFVMSYSCGKDSTLALYRMIKRGYKPVCLLITVSKEKERSLFHGIPFSLIEEVSMKLDIPVYLADCRYDKYDEDFKNALIEIKEKFNASICAFGDIDLIEHKNWDINVCNMADIEPTFPLWNEERKKLTYEFIESGFKAIIKNVNLNYMGDEFLGEELNLDLIPKIKETGSDICGENGEYHTFVYDGPIFNKKVEFNIKGKVKINEYGFLDIVK